jgi:histone H3/H4
MAEKRKKSKVTSESRKSEGLKPTTAARIMKQESSIKEVRISAGAAGAVVSMVNRDLRMLGKKALAYLEVSKKKTVTSSLLGAVIESSHFRCGLGLASASLVSDKKQLPKDLSMAPILRAFGKGIPLGKGKYRIGSKGKIALVKIARQMIANASRDASRFVESAGRKTIISKDIDQVQNAREHK